MLSLCSNDVIPGVAGKTRPVDRAEDQEALLLPHTSFVVLVERVLYPTICVSQMHTSVVHKCTYPWSTGETVAAEAPGDLNYCASLPPELLVVLIGLTYGAVAPLVRCVCVCVCVCVYVWEYLSLWMFTVSALYVRILIVQHNGDPDCGCPFESHS